MDVVFRALHGRPVAAVRELGEEQHPPPVPARHARDRPHVLSVHRPAPRSRTIPLERSPRSLRATSSQPTCTVSPSNTSASSANRSPMKSYTAGTAGE